MMPDKHLISGMLLGAILYMFGSNLLPVLLIIIVSVMIDIDHIPDYLIKFKRYGWTNIKRPVKLKQSNEILPIFIFHNIETLILLLIASMFFNIFLYVFVSVLLHMILDWKVLLASKHPFIIKASMILVLLENRRRRKGYHKW